MDIVQQLSDELDAAQNELAQAEISLLEATARAVSLREQAARLTAAVAAMKGESPPTAAPPTKHEEEPAERPKPQESNDPLAHARCAGCGLKGTLTEVMRSTPGGAIVRMLECRKCGNQVL